MTVPCSPQPPAGATPCPCRARVSACGAGGDWPVHGAGRAHGPRLGGLAAPVLTWGLVVRSTTPNLGLGRYCQASIPLQPCSGIPPARSPTGPHLLAQVWVQVCASHTAPWQPSPRPARLHQATRSLCTRPGDWGLSQDCGATLEDALPLPPPGCPFCRPHRNGTWMDPSQKQPRSPPRSRVARGGGLSGLAPRGAGAPLPPGHCTRGGSVRRAAFAPVPLPRVLCPGHSLAKRCTHSTSSARAPRPAFS